jgi:hypothetical protein
MWYNKPMKLLNCTLCNDVVALAPETRTCYCGKASGKYINRMDVEVKGKCRILGMRNDQYLQSFKDNNPRANYNWFVIAVSEKEEGMIYKSAY